MKRLPHMSAFWRHRFPLLTACLTFAMSTDLNAADQPQWGERHTRNMVSDEKDLPEEFDPASEDGIRWSVDLGSKAYGTPIVSQGRVFVGTNNSVPFDAAHEGSHGVLLCLNELDGKLLWQLVVPRRKREDGGEDPYLDQPEIALCSPPTVEGDRVYVVTNRAEVVCLDLHGMSNGNDGPYRSEGQHLVQPGETPKTVSQLDADIIWLYDMPSQAGIHPHDSPHSSILIDGRYLYLNTGNGVDNTHRKIRCPDGPSLIVLEKQAGRLVAQDGEGIGPRIFHCTWSAPAMGVVNGKPLVFFCGGDGVVYAFESLAQDLKADDVQLLKRVWRFDCDPDAPKEDVHRFVGNRSESPTNIMGMPVFYKDRIYVCGGGDFWWGKREAFVKCIDATQRGDITTTGEIWSHALANHACATPAIVDDLVFVGDLKRGRLGGNLYCLDAATGEEYWQAAMKGDVWSTILAADGKIYVGSGGTDLAIFKASRQRQLISTTEFDDRILTTPTAANGRLYINSLSRLYVIEN